MIVYAKLLIFAEQCIMSLLEKLAKIQAIIERTTFEGERQAAALAMERLFKQQKQQPIEYRVTLSSIWQKNLFVALCKKYGLKRELQNYLSALELKKNAANPDLLVIFQF
jgi:hypothetical protein